MHLRIWGWFSKYWHGVMSSGLKLWVRNENIIFLFLIQNICCGYLKEPSQWNGSFEHPKHMLKLLSKKYFQFYAENVRWSKPVVFVTNITICLTIVSNNKYIITGLDKQNKKIQLKIVNIFLHIIFNICFGCSKEPSHWDGSFEYPQHMFWLRNKKIIFLLRMQGTKHSSKLFYVIWMSKFYAILSKNWPNTQIMYIRDPWFMQ